ncbi:F0F1 ATP synthase subunit epsilon [Actibacterium sp. XHP0104]|uniref:F0F1 ATP synthase subunit epsilon n=1 Tax=Actibacterium sp. XHP0104 TaxID=2984335 RepID=UPI0021E89B79|nr:F0F1 ATP synthase subunit epsilon [Actibacterium sp. XHP0104]MCV2882269.1 F0F1 ATP synthase subunit epsilon [Actibacterium sp. XHP0104]
MAETMQFDLVSPERSLASFAATEVQIPGAEGDMTAMPGHSPVITTLRPGVVRVKAADGDKNYVVTSGFVEVTASSVSVIAERAHAGSEVTKADLEDVIAEARARAQAAAAEDKDGAEKFVADLVHLLDDMD